MSDPSSKADPQLLAELRHFRKLAAAMPHDDVKMDLPEGARVKIEQGAWNVKWRKYLFVVSPSSQEGFDHQVALFNEPAGQYARFYSIKVTPVVFGDAKGVKRVTVIEEVGSKSVDYALQVPGGFVFVGIVKRGLAWDESEWEQFFHTIIMIKNESYTAESGSRKD